MATKEQIFKRAAARIEAKERLAAYEIVIKDISHTGDKQTAEALARRKEYLQEIIDKYRLA